MFEKDAAYVFSECTYVRLQRVHVRTSSASAACVSWCGENERVQVTFTNARQMFSFFLAKLPARTLFPHFLAYENSLRIILGASLHEQEQTSLASRI